MSCRAWLLGAGRAVQHGLAGRDGHNGGCMNTGGICIGCTMHRFPRCVCSVLQEAAGNDGVLEHLTQHRFIRVLFAQVHAGHQNLTSHWKKTNQVPSGWANVDGKRGIGKEAVGFSMSGLRASAPNSRLDRSVRKSFEVGLSLSESGRH